LNETSTVCISEKKFTLGKKGKSTAKKERRGFWSNKGGGKEMLR